MTSTESQQTREKLQYQILLTKTHIRGKKKNKKTVYCQCGIYISPNKTE